ncbi:MAG: M28 family peptidase [Clostridia bacterium]|nr:M28 family peptidase [Clostridia bacterium]
MILNIEETCISCLDTDWSYQLARRMEKEKTNPVLGYRTAGSHAETATGDMLYHEMIQIGLSDVTKDTFALDGWEFQKAVLRYTDFHGKEHIFQMGGYQTDFLTDGFKDYELVFLGRGTSSEYDGIDVKGKIVLAEINQRDEWWISFPVYQAYLRGAAALIAVQANGYGEIADTALNAQDIAGPEYAPAFSISQADARILKEDLKEKSSIHVSLDASSKVTPNVKASNIVGRIPGTETDSMILLSAHYDSYFDGFQDDNTAVAMMLSIARALIKGGYRPAHTLVFCAMAAEEWGVTDSKYDWSTGAYNEIFRVHPNWQGKIIANLNFELPAHAHNTRDAIRCTYEYADFIREFTDSLNVPPEAYPDGITVLCPIETWSDDFSMAIAGVPSMVNDFSAGPFMQNYYHSQYDNRDVYQEPVFRFHHECYLKLIMAFDRLVLPPLNFSRTMNATIESIQETAQSFASEEINSLTRQLQNIIKCTDAVYSRICHINKEYLTLDDQDSRISFRRKYSESFFKLLKFFRKTQDYFVRLNWQDEVIFPQAAASKNVCQLEKAMKALTENDITDALRSLYQVDNNMYAFLFDEEVYYHFTEYILHQPKDRLMWGADRIMHHENLYGIVQQLKKKLKTGSTQLDEEIRRLDAALRRQKSYYLDDLRYISRSAQKLDQMLKEIQKML